METPFCRDVRSHFSREKDFEQLFTTAKRIASELGTWPSDAFCLSDMETRKLEGKAERKFYRSGRAKDPATLDNEIKALRDAHEYVKQQDRSSTPRLDLRDLSPKVLRLERCLQLHFERPSATRCLVFVEERSTAKLLESIFNKIGGTYIRSGSLVGSSSQSFDGMKNTFKQQTLTLTKFRKGEINCLVSSG